MNGSWLNTQPVKVLDSFNYSLVWMIDQAALKSIQRSILRIGVYDLRSIVYSARNRCDKQLNWLPTGRIAYSQSSSKGTLGVEAKERLTWARGYRPDHLTPIWQPTGHTYAHPTLIRKPLCRLLQCLLILDARLSVWNDMTWKPKSAPIDGRSATIIFFDKPTDLIRDVSPWSR